MPTNTTAPSVGDVKRLTVALTQTGSTAHVDGTVRYIIDPPNSSAFVVGTSASTAVAAPGSTNFVHSSTGTYYYDLLYNDSGDWKWRFESTGAILASTGGRFAVRPQIASTGA